MDDLKGTTYRPEMEPERMSYLGSSELASVFGLSVFDTPGSVWSRKTGRRKDDGPSTPDQLRGIHLEAVVRDKVLPSRESVLHVEDDELFYLHPEAPVGCHPDGKIEVTRTGRGTLEIKCPNRMAFQKYRDDGLPSSNVLQLLTTTALTGEEVGYFAVHNADSWETLLFPLELDQENERAVASVLQRATEWWHTYVATGERPPEFGYAEPPKLPELRGDLIYRDDDEWHELMEEYRKYREIRAALDHVYKGTEEEPGLKEKIVLAMGEESKVAGAGWKMQRIQVERRNFSKKLLEGIGPLDPEKVRHQLEEVHGFDAADEVISSSRLHIDDERLYSVSRYETLRGDEVEDPLA